MVLAGHKTRIATARADLLSNVEEARLLRRACAQIRADMQTLAGNHAMEKVKALRAMEEDRVAVEARLREARVQIHTMEERMDVITRAMVGKRERAVRMFQTQLARSKTPCRADSEQLSDLLSKVHHLQRLEEARRGAETVDRMASARMERLAARTEALRARVERKAKALKVRMPMVLSARAGPWEVAVELCLPDRVDLQVVRDYMLRHLSRKRYRHFARHISVARVDIRNADTQNNCTQSLRGAHSSPEASRLRVSTSEVAALWEMPNYERMYTETGFASGAGMGSYLHRS